MLEDCVKDMDSRKIPLTKRGAELCTAEGIIKSREEEAVTRWETANADSVYKALSIETRIFKRSRPDLRLLRWRRNKLF